MSSHDSDEEIERITSTRRSEVSSSPDTDDEELDECGRLRLEVQELIAPHALTEEEPPFSAEELVALACLHSDYATQGLSITDISHEILEMFPYYRRRAMRHYARMQCINPENNPEDVEHEEIFAGFQDVFKQWEVPLLCRDDPKRAVFHWDAGEEEMWVPPRAGRLFLRHWLENKAKGTFPFLKLPAELRNTIYEIIFSFPKEGFVVHGASSFLELTRRPEQPPDLELFDTYVRGFDANVSGSEDIEGFEIMQPQQNLALLQVSKQVHDEALSFFFQLNRFWCVGEGGVIDFLNRLSMRRAEHLQDLRIDVGYMSGEIRAFPVAMRKLARVKRLRSLCVHVRTDGWFQMTERSRMVLGRRTKFTKYEQIPGFKDLAKACWKAVTVQWDGGQHEAIRAWVESQEPEAQRKRKREQQKAGAGKKSKVA